MIDRINLLSGESYEFQTDGNQYVVVVSCVNKRKGNAIQVLKGDTVLATLGWLETYSCPQNSGTYIVRNTSDVSADVLLVRYILL